MTPESPIDVGPRRRWRHVVVLSTVALLAFVALAFVVARAKSPPVGRLGYQTTGIGGGSGGFWVAGRPYRVTSPPLYDVGSAPIVLQQISMITTGCKVRVLEDGLFRVHEAGYQEALGPTSARDLQRFGYRGPIGSVRGLKLRHSTEFDPSYVEVYTIVPPSQRTFAVLGFKVRFDSGGTEITQYLGYPETFLPILAGHTAFHAPFGRIDNIGSRIGVTPDGETRGFACEPLAPYEGS